MTTDFISVVMVILADFPRIRQETLAKREKDGRTATPASASASAGAEVHEAPMMQLSQRQNASAIIASKTNTGSSS